MRLMFDDLLNIGMPSDKLGQSTTLRSLFSALAYVTAFLLASLLLMPGFFRSLDAGGTQAARDANQLAAIINGALLIYACVVSVTILMILFPTAAPLRNLLGGAATSGFLTQVSWQLAQSAWWHETLGSTQYAPLLFATLLVVVATFVSWILWRSIRFTK